MNRVYVKDLYTRKFAASIVSEIKSMQEQLNDCGVYRSSQDSFLPRDNWALHDLQDVLTRTRLELNQWIARYDREIS